jgi:hypothetical protein
MAPHWLPHVGQRQDKAKRCLPEARPHTNRHAWSETRNRPHRVIERHSFSRGGARGAWRGVALCATERALRIRCKSPC